MKYDEALKFM